MEHTVEQEWMVNDWHIAIPSLSCALVVTFMCKGSCNAD